MSAVRLSVRSAPAFAFVRRAKRWSVRGRKVRLYTMNMVDMGLCLWWLHVGDEKFTVVASDVSTEHAKSVQKHEAAKFNVMGTLSCALRPRLRLCEEPSVGLSAAGKFVYTQ